ncbi:uncharacterized protein UTRI_00461_B [Ustilago trichophora]|uniref:Histone-lysine N-methyltransferase n=1 Tax=Ustilago trichophora TaxID=86804 RepID=A0A5C3DRK9_9BASI|nr:uncharacterized protein UTRI_00461_B [Ustilago trichophora]
MAPARKSARPSLSASANSPATASAATKSQQTSTAANTSSSASTSTSKPASRTARQFVVSQVAPVSPSKTQGNNSYEHPIVLSDTSDTDNEVEEVPDSSDDEVTAPTALTPSPNASKQNMSLLSPSAHANISVERSHSTSSLDRSYAASLNSDLNAISDGTLSSLSSIDSDSDGTDSDDRGAQSSKRIFRPSQSNRPASTPSRGSVDPQETTSQSSSSTPTPSRRSARIVTSGSSVQKALQRRDELDAKLTASPARKKLDSPEAPPPSKRLLIRPRKSAPDATLAASSNVGLAAQQTPTSASPQSSSASASARRSSRLSLPSASAMAAPASPSRHEAVAQSPVVKEAPLQEAGREIRRGRRSRGSEPAAEASTSSLSSSPVSSSMPSSVVSTSAAPSANAGASAADNPVKRGRGRPRKSADVASPSPLTPASSAADPREDAVTARLRKRSLSSVATSAAPASPIVADKEDSTSPRRKRGRPTRKSLHLEEEVSNSAAPGTPEPPQAARANGISRQQAIDMLDDDLSELSDDSDMSVDSPAPSQSEPTGPARRGRPPLARAAEARRIKRAARQDKDGKSYHYTGLYAGEADAVASTSTLRPGEAQNPVLPMPIHFGAKLLTEERDFCLPYPIHQKMDQLRDRVNAKRKPPRYQHISKNKYVSRPKLHGEVPLCNCKPGSGCGADCLNRMLMFICDPRTCPSASNCTNVSLGRRPAVKTAVSYYGRRGFGLKTLEPIKKDDFIDEYRGEVIDLTEAGKRVTEEYKATGNFYLLDYDSAAGELLDGGRKGNITRFANHSCDPNCRIEKFIICGTDEALSAEFQIGLFATRDIEAGEELTYNYGWSRFQPRDITGAPTHQVPIERCLCGAANCSGILGGKKAPPTKAAVADVVANSRKKTAKGRGKGKGRARKAVQGSRVRMRAMTPMHNASRLSAAAMPSSSLAITARNSRKRDEPQSSFLSKVAIKRRERSARAANDATSSASLSVPGSMVAAATSESSVGAVDAMDVDEPSTPTVTEQTIAAQQSSTSSHASSSSASIVPSSHARTTSIVTSHGARVVGPIASKDGDASGSGSSGSEGPANATSAAPVKATSKTSGSLLMRLPLLKGLSTSRAGSAFGRAATAARGTKDRRCSAAEALISDNDESSSLERDLSDSDGLLSDFQKQDDGPQQHPALKKAAGKPGRRGRHKLQLSSEEAERRAADRRARNAFLARVRRASKRGIVIQDPTQHPLKKISIQCTAAPENTYIPDLPSSLVTLGMSTADARRARNAFLARVRRAMKRGYAKDLAIKMAAKPLPGDAARDTPVMKAQRAYMEQLEREAVDELSASVGSGAQGGEGSRMASNSQQTTASGAAAGEDSWVDESSWASPQK